MDDQQLNTLEAILAKDLAPESQFDMILGELREMGMEEEDVRDLETLSNLMYEYLMKVPEIQQKLEMSEEYDLLDNIRLYLLGLPNKVGPLGYIALHHVLEEESDDGGEIVDVVVEPIEHVSTTLTPESSSYEGQTPAFRRKRAIDKVLKKLDVQIGGYNSNDGSKKNGHKHGHKY